MKNVQLKWTIKSSDDDEVVYHAESPIYRHGMTIIQEFGLDRKNTNFYPVDVTAFNKAYATLEEAQKKSQEEHDKFWLEFCKKWDLVQPEYNHYQVWSYDEYLDKFFTKAGAETYMKRLVDSGVYKAEDLKIKEVK